jgi:hypothetical protein
MRLTSLVGLLLVLGLIGFVGYVAWVQPEWAMSWLREARREVAGFAPAKTPQELLDKFKDAVKRRDYDAAATYCTADYAEQLRKGGPAASKLGTAIDTLEDKLEQKGLKSDKVVFVLRSIDPFPKDIKFANLRYKEGEDKATVFVGEDVKPVLPIDLTGWKYDPTFSRALIRAMPQGTQLGLVRVGEGDKQRWQIDFKVSDALRQAVDQLKDKHMKYVNGFDKLKYEILNTPMTNKDVEKRLKEELADAMD